MAVFGLPAAPGDDAERAIAAALALRDQVRADERLASRLAIRFGVSTGEVVAARDPSAGDFLGTGGAGHGAARPPPAPGPRQGLGPQRTAHAPAGPFGVGTAPAVAAKGQC